MNQSQGHSIRNSDANRPAAIDVAKIASLPAENHNDSMLQREDSAEQILDQNWYELRFDGKQPGRRAYHTSFINEDKVYVFGGHDIAEG